MSGIFSGLQAIVSVIQTLVNNFMLGVKFLINIIKSTTTMIQMLITTTANASLLIETLPVWLIGFASCCVTISIIYLIVGREGGK